MPQATRGGMRGNIESIKRQKIFLPRHLPSAAHYHQNKLKSKITRTSSRLNNSKWASLTSSPMPALPVSSPKNRAHRSFF